jgi:hypothetical protein
VLLAAGVEASVRATRQALLELVARHRKTSAQRR